MSAPLVPARPAFAPDGTAYSETYGDVYHSAAGGLAQARHVFLGGNDLPARWQGRGRFVVLEAGFGFGLNFLATWQAWREDARRCPVLHYVAVEKHPFSAGDLARLHRPHVEAAALAAELRAAWPMLVPGMHRLALDDGRVVLTIAFADIAAALPQLRLAADALYLDGFAPARNPDMWSPASLKRLSRLCAAGATAATWSVAGEVREALRAAGFAVEKRPGFAAKREMLAAVARPRRAAASSSRVPAPVHAQLPGAVTGAQSAGARVRSVIVVGAGIAGAAVCERFAARGWEVDLIERRSAPAQEASGNLAGTFHPLVAPDDSVFARLTRAAFLYLLASPVERSACGVLQLARDAREEAAQRRALATFDYTDDYAQWVDAARASAIAGVRVDAGGLWFPQAGWLRPAAMVGGMLARCGARLVTRFDTPVASIARDGDAWIACDAQGAAIARAATLVLANADDALRLAPDAAVRLRRVRGQLTHLPAGRLAALRSVILRGGFVLPPADGTVLTGASFDFDDEDAAVRAEDHAGNLERLERIVPGASSGIDPATLEGRVAWRATVPDRLPMIGPMADARGPGLYGAFAFGSRGLLWAGLGAELIASHAASDPLPLEGKLVDALDPGRFRLRAQRRAPRPATTRGIRARRASSQMP